MSSAETATIETRVPARLDRLPWSRFHWLVVIGLGTVWILDGLEVTLVGSIASRLTEDGSGIAISTGQIGTAAAFYVAGACTGALFFGQLTDRFGRKKLFLITLAVYLLATGATAFAFAPWYFFAARFLTGAGIGGEYAAINSAIDELIPARVRGRVDLIINGSYWLGSAGGSAAALIFLDTGIFAKDLGWRLAFAMGVALGVVILLVRRNVPESPRWLFIHGREEEAEAIVDGIEEGVREETGDELPEPDDSITVRQREQIPFRTIARTAFKVYPQRAVLGLALFVGQAFIYNGVTFNLGTLFTTFYDVSSAIVPVFIVIYAIGNFLGPVTLGRLFDTVGRKPMIAGTYLGSAAVAGVLSILFVNDSLTTWWFEALVVVTFFLASAGASAAYLTVSEIFPMETRALAIAFFYAIGTAVGGITGPLLFGHLIASGERGQVVIAFVIGAVVMALGGIAELFFGVKAEQTELEDIAKPLTAEEAEEGGPEAEGEPAPEHDDALRCRRSADEERARAAEHRAAVHELRPRAEAGDQQAAERAAAEQVLAQIADLRADTDDERASAYDARAEAGDDHDAVANARAEVHERRARMHAERAEAVERRGEGDEDAARDHERAAAEAEELALAAEERLHAAEARRDAEQASGEEQADAERREAAERRRQALERERRIRERLMRRRQREREGLRRFRPGPGSVSSSPGMGIPRTREAREDDLEHEIDVLERALEEHGPTDRRELARITGARYWGPGRFGAAVQAAADEGRLRRLSRSTLAPAAEDDGPEP